VASHALFVVDLVEFSPNAEFESKISRVMPELSEYRETVPSLERSILIGGVGLALVSLFVFATVAFAERWMYESLGLAGAYLAWTVLFIVLGGGALGSLVVNRWRLPKFYLLFGLAFFVYAAGWTTAYFILGGRAGELLGSLVGSLLMGMVLTLALSGIHAQRRALGLSLVLFVANSIGYFLGSMINDSLGGRPGMLMWGVLYGLCLGAGLGIVLHFAQVRRSS
jgi:hypothetical protein